MALQRRHSDPVRTKPYDPDMDLSSNQRKRFSDVANKAEEKREKRDLYKAVLDPVRARAQARAQAKAKMQQEQPGKAGKKRRIPELSPLRVIVWSLVLVIFWLWVQFMFPSQ
ncbi:hypothetical protein L3Q72_18170 [Vibrio sp. JC009]|uniref:hypothetical protein n=1 Tax=Vibrio sp. JC009 TaxID=2912314 RepID=UPI0023AE8C21|nr:hypothetical protein [Vibrio sp. JC009]WED24803.1 hypothetical protein L3Q72_18170 [Vibrio sp. JC009]